MSFRTGNIWPGFERIRMANLSCRSYRLLQSGDCVPATRRHFCTLFHRFAQRFDQNLIDGSNGTLYLARQIEPGSFGTLRINLEGAASLTAAAPPGWFRKVRNFTVPFRGRNHLTAVAPRD